MPAAKRREVEAGNRAKPADDARRKAAGGGGGQSGDRVSPATSDSVARRAQREWEHLPLAAEEIGNPS